MRGTAVKSVVITPDRKASLDKRLAQVRERIGKRAFELYCGRACANTAESDWLEAERETVLIPLAGIEDRDGDIRITAAVPDVDADHLTVDVLPGSIVVEGEPAGDPSRTRYSVFPLHERIDPAAVTAEFSNGDLTVVVPKIAGPKADSGRPSNTHSGDSKASSHPTRTPPRP